MEAAVAERLGRLPPRVQRRLARRPPIVIDGQRLETDVQLMLDPADPLRSPLLSPRLAESAPALAITAGFDPLRDEGAAYAEALRSAGVKAQPRRFPGLFHGCVNSISASPSSHDALVEVAGMTRALLRSG